MIPVLGFKLTEPKTMHCWLLQLNFVFSLPLSCLKYFFYVLDHALSLAGNMEWKLLKQSASDTTPKIWDFFDFYNTQARTHTQTHTAHTHTGNKIGIA